MTKIVCCEYIWLGGGDEFRSKTKVIYDFNTDNLFDVKQYPLWNYDGSSTRQADGQNSEILLHPVCIFKDPFKYNSHNVLVLCDTYDSTFNPLENNHRLEASKIFDKKLEEKPWYGIEQEFYIFGNTGSQWTPLGYQFNKEQGQYYCSVGGENTFGRHIVDDALNACIMAGVKVSGMNAEVGPGQWEIQVGPCEGIAAGDHVLMLRYILHRISEKYNVKIDYEPKPVHGDYNGSGCHTNYSTKSMREGLVLSADESAVNKKNGKNYSDLTGYECIELAIKKLENAHMDHMRVYGKDNDKRMTGLHETADYNTFTYGVADRSASIRIPRQTFVDKKGYLEDRRPSSNMDPYIVTSKLFKTTVLEK